jgi:hypothetical protein
MNGARPAVASAFLRRAVPRSRRRRAALRLDPRRDHARGGVTQADRDRGGERIREPLPLGVVERSRLLPDGAVVDPAALREVGRELADALDNARRVDTVLRDDDAKELWREPYPRLTREVPGMTGAMRSRAEAQTLRLSHCWTVSG